MTYNNLQPFPKILVVRFEEITMCISQMKRGNFRHIQFGQFFFRQIQFSQFFEDSEEALNIFFNNNCLLHPKCVKTHIYEIS